MAFASMTVGFALIPGPQSPRDIRSKVRNWPGAPWLGGILIIQECLADLEQLGLASRVEDSRRNVWALSEDGLNTFTWSRSTTEEIRSRIGFYGSPLDDHFAGEIAPVLEHLAAGHESPRAAIMQAGRAFNGESVSDNIRNGD